MAPSATASADEIDKTCARRPQPIVLRPLPPLVLQSANNRITIQLSTSTTPSLKIMQGTVRRSNEVLPNRPSFGGVPDYSDNDTIHRAFQSMTGRMNELAGRDELSKAKKELTDKIEDVSKTLTTFQTDTRTRFDTFGTRIRELQVVATETNERVDRLETKVDRLETKVDRLETKVDRLETKMDMILERLGLQAEPAPALPNLRPQASSPSTSRFTNITTSSHLTVNTQVPAAPSSHSPSGSIWSRFNPSASPSAPADPASVAGSSPRRRLFKSKSFTGTIFGTGSKKGKESRKDA